jgi:hypothetical protein
MLYIKLQATGWHYLKLILKSWLVGYLGFYRPNPEFEKVVSGCAVYPGTIRFLTEYTW